MVTKLQKIISKIEKRHSKKIDLSLDRTFNLLNKLGNPQNKIKNVVTVVGTNSKASMATALSTILKESGYKYNLYTSPHLQSYTERFVFNNEEIKKAKKAYSILFENGENEFKDRIEKLKSENIDSSVVNELINFVTQKGNRSYCLPEEL